MKLTLKVSFLFFFFKSYLIKIKNTIYNTFFTNQNTWKIYMDCKHLCSYFESFSLQHYSKKKLLTVKIDRSSEYKQKVDLVDREEDDSLEYNLKATWFFNPSRSEGLTGEEELVVPHVLILSMIKLTLEQQPAAMGILSEFFDHSFYRFASNIFPLFRFKSEGRRGFTLEYLRNT